jgi:hypothetical protein
MAIALGDQSWGQRESAQEGINQRNGRLRQLPRVHFGNGKMNTLVNVLMTRAAEASKGGLVFRKTMFCKTMFLKNMGSAGGARRTLSTLTLLRLVLASVVTSVALLGQSSDAGPRDALELPAILRQSVTAGVTPIGAKVQAKLTVATLVNGIVVPRDAVLSGEVTESAAKSASEPSRLAIRLDSAQWNNGSAEIKAYLTAWFYRTKPLPGCAPLGNPAIPADGTSPRTVNPVYSGSPTPPFPAPAHDKETDPTPSASDSQTSPYRVALKNVQSVRNPAGGVTLVSTRSNIKLDKYTAYVFAAGAGDTPLTK